MEDCILEFMKSQKLHFSSALTATSWADDVVIDIDSDGMIEKVETKANGGTSIKGVALPAVPNVHSHAHQRFMMGLAERAGPGADSFWTWREIMYGFALRLAPEDLEAVAAQLYVEMLKAGFSVVGEFQYLHHQPDGTPYDNPAEMSLRCLTAAEQAGIAITILPTFYAYGGLGGKAPTEGQRRFINNTDRFLRIYKELQPVTAGHALRRLGVSPHSLRAIAPRPLQEIIDSIESNSPIHIHVAEQIKEVDACVAFIGHRPVAMLLKHFDVSDRWTVIHATHMTLDETTRLAESSAIVGLCPTTEANLGDGIFPAVDYLKAGGFISIGSDSHISVSPADDIRQLEYSQRLRDRTRNALASGPGQSTGRTLFDAILKGGAKSVVQPVGAIAPGHRADIVVLDDEHPSLIGRAGDALLDTWIFSSGNACVKDVFVAGEHLVQDRHHIREEEVERVFRAAVKRLS